MINNNDCNNKKEPVAPSRLKQATSLPLSPHGGADLTAIGGRHGRLQSDKFHGVQFLRSQQLLNYSRISHCMEPEGSL
jgi:hypothetical protein